jgi:hypothetical protein
MEIKITTSTMLKMLYILSWIIFVGLCIEAGGFLTNTIYTLAISPNLASHFWGKLDLSNLYNYDAGQFFVVTTFMNIVAILKAILFYSIIKVLHDRHLDMQQPFNHAIRKFISGMAFNTLFIGLFSMWGKSYVLWLETKNVQLPKIELLKIGGADVWFFMGIVLLVIAQIFKKGIEIQEENELTV